MKEAFCLFEESKKRIYYCSTFGRVLSVSKKNKKNYHFLKEITGRKNTVRINGRRISVPMAMALSFFKRNIETYSPSSIGFYFKDGNPKNLKIDNILFYFENIRPLKSEENLWSELTTTFKSTDG